MKKQLIAGAFLATAVVIISSAIILKPAQATRPATTNATGIVTQNAHPLANVTVTVQCNTATGRDITDSSGAYLVIFTSTECPAGSVVQSTAQTDSQTGQASAPARVMSSKLIIANATISLQAAE